MAAIEGTNRTGVRLRSGTSAGGRAEKIQVGDISLNVARSGEGPAVLFMHGLASNMGLWALLDWSQLAGYTIIRYDLRGFGGSAWPGGTHSFEQHLEDLLGLLAALQIEQVALVGHSLGGMLGLALAATAPEKVRSLTLISCAATFTPVRRAALYNLAAAVEANGPVSIAEKLLEGSFSPTFRAANPRLMQSIRQGIKVSDAGSLAAAFRMVAELDLRSRLGQVGCPTQILVGEQDELTPVALVEELYKALPAGARLHRLAACGHTAPLEQPGLVTAYIAEFVKELAAKG
jgi:3-oxoadipate enol-lactonase